MSLGEVVIGDDMRVEGKQIRIMFLMEDGCFLDGHDGDDESQTTSSLSGDNWYAPNLIFGLFMNFLKNSDDF